MKIPILGTHEGFIFSCVAIGALTKNCRSYNKVILIKTIILTVLGLALRIRGIFAYLFWIKFAIYRISNLFSEGSHNKLLVLVVVLVKYIILKKIKICVERPFELTLMESTVL